MLYLHFCVSRRNITTLWEAEMRVWSPRTLCVSVIPLLSPTAFFGEHFEILRSLDAVAESKPTTEDKQSALQGTAAVSYPAGQE